MKPNASRTVSRVMPINAKNAPLLRVMVEIIRPQLRSRQHLPDSRRGERLHLTTEVDFPMTGSALALLQTPAAGEMLVVDAIP